MPFVTEALVDPDQSDTWMIVNPEQVVIEELEPEEILADALFLSPAMQCHAKDKLFEVPVILAHTKKTTAMIDTGASINMISTEFAKTLTLSRADTVAPDCSVRVANGAVVQPLSKIFVSVEIDGKGVNERTPFLVMKDLPYPVIIGLGFLKENSVSLVFGPERNRIVIGETVYESHAVFGSPLAEVAAFVAVEQRLKARSETNVRIRIPFAKEGAVHVGSGLPSLASEGLYAPRDCQCLFVRRDECRS